MPVPADVPCPINYLQLEEARQWATRATELRPWRSDMFSALAHQVSLLTEGRAARILELGSGPGLLAYRLFERAPNLSYVGIDNSAAMHYLARERNFGRANQIELLERSFKGSDWARDIGKFDLVVTNQAVHELRHKRHAATLHLEVSKILNAGGAYLVSDHFLGEDAMTNSELYMTQDEQLECLRSSGFSNVARIFQVGDLVLHKAS